LNWLQIEVSNELLGLSKRKVLDIELNRAKTELLMFFDFEEKG